MYYIYKITNLINQKIYIGQTINPSHRWSQHLSEANTGTKHPLYNSMRFHGTNNFSFELIACSKTIIDIDYTEIELIKQYDSRNRDRGYNLAVGGNNQVGKNNPMFGKKLSPEVCEKKRQSMLGKNKGKKRTPEQIAKQTKYNFTEEQKLAIINDPRGKRVVAKDYGCSSFVIQTIRKRATP